MPVLYLCIGISKFANIQFLELHLLRIARFAYGVRLRYLPLFLGEIHFAVLDPASYLPVG
jgi:hypothetical protein